MMMRHCRHRTWACSQRIQMTAVPLHSRNWFFCLERHDLKVTILATNRLNYFLRNYFRWAGQSYIFPEPFKKNELSHVLDSFTNNRILKAANDKYEHNDEHKMKTRWRCISNSEVCNLMQYRSVMFRSSTFLTRYHLFSSTDFKMYSPYAGYGIWSRSDSCNSWLLFW